MTTITNLKCEYRKNPIGLDELRPRFSWQMRTDRMGARQVAFRILAASQPDRLNAIGADLWDSGRVASDQSIHVTYEGKTLISRQNVFWKVQVWDETGTELESEMASFEMGLLAPEDWQAEWIGTSLAGGPRSTVPVPYLRKTFDLQDGIAAARLYITALGVFECTINGEIVGEDVFAPGWTDYNQRVQYLTYDVTSLLNSDKNALGVLLGDGWAAGYIAWLDRQYYVDRPRLLAQLEVTYTDGTTRTIPTDQSWVYQFGPITHSDFLMGEAYDARKELGCWDTPEASSSGWLPIETFQHRDVKLVAMKSPTIQRIEELKPIYEPVNRSSMGRRRYVFDFGQNMVGRIRFKGSALAGTTVIFRFAEVLNPDGSLYTTNLRSAHATDYYTFKGEDEEVWEPKFTFHGFRYVEIEGYPNEVNQDTLTGIVLHSAMDEIGEFTCSDPLLNQLQSNIVWGQKGNFLDVPTDCPQRDERLGWTGDIQVFVRTAAFNMDVAAFMTKWGRDVQDAQSPAGEVPAVVPHAAGVPQDGGPAWADAVIICPWTIYLSYGDKRILENNYEAMSRFMDFLITSSPGLIRCAPEYEGWPGYGDWLSINASTPRDLIGTAFLAHDAKLMQQIAGVLNRSSDVVRFQQLFQDTRQAFAQRYLKGSQVSSDSNAPSEMRRQMDAADALSRGNLQVVDYGAVTSEVFNTDLFTPSQTAYVLALHFDLLPEELRAAAVDELVDDIERRGMHLSTGFIGSPYLNHVLSEHDRLDFAYTLLNQTSWPSWLYAVTQGATTIWERWDGWTEDNGFQTPEMNSFNHYAYGAIGAWMYSTVAGIDVDPAVPGYKHSIVQPQPGGGLTSARGRLATPYGDLVSEWMLENAVFEWRVIVPPNTSASIHVPAGDNRQITMNGQPVDENVIEVLAGTYDFVVR